MRIWAIILFCLFSLSASAQLMVSPRGSSGGASAGGVQPNLQINGGAGSLAAYAGTACPVSQYPNGLDLNGAVTGCAGTATPTGAAGGDLSGTYPNPGVAKLNAVAAASYARLDLADQTLSGGANVTSANLGTKSSGTLTIDCGTAPLQFVTNGGAFTLASPANDGSCTVLVTNNASAGAITPSGFSVGVNTGDSLDTTNTHKFMIAVRRINGTSAYSVQANQ